LAGLVSREHGGEGARVLREKIELRTGRGFFVFGKKRTEKVKRFR